MFKPPFFNHTNTKFDKKDIEFVIDEYKKKVPFKQNNYSSYHKDHPKPEYIWLEKYVKIIKDIMLNLGLEQVTKYSYLLWGQLYVNGCNHSPHHHFHCDELRSDISFVHFIKTEEPLFQFLNLKKDKFIPINQNNGDIIVFPSWLWHTAITNNLKKERFIIAGNITINYIDQVPKYS